MVSRSVHDVTVCRFVLISCAKAGRISALKCFGRPYYFRQIKVPDAGCDMPQLVCEWETHQARGQRDMENSLKSQEEHSGYCADSQSLHENIERTYPDEW